MAVAVVLAATVLTTAAPSQAQAASSAPSSVLTTPGFVPDSENSSVTTPIVVRLNRRVTATVRVVSNAGVVVRTLFVHAQLAAGDSVVSWDGRAADGAQVPAGSYRVVLTAAPAAGAQGAAATVVTEAAVMVERPAVEVTALNLSRGFISTAIRGRSLTARLRMSRRGNLSAVVADAAGNVLTNLLVGAAPAGTHQLVWTGKTDAGQQVPDGSYMLLVAASASGLPVRTISLPVFVDRTAPKLTIPTRNLITRVARRRHTISLQLQSSEAGQLEITNGKRIWRVASAAGASTVAVNLSSLGYSTRQATRRTGLRVRFVDHAGNASPAQRVVTRPGAHRPSASTPVTTTPPPATGNTRSARAADMAMKYLGVPYLWAGASPLGFDCSGLVMYAFAAQDMTLPHSTYELWNLGSHVTIGQLKKGDLVFFNKRDHMGIYLGGGQFVHAPHSGEVVKVSPMTGWYAKSFDGGVRLSS
ncbi:MAG: C40 family peptidase [Thermoleophilia bacterium]|nr:C40 family peptidase [Thermoleophilia bacterium]